MPFTKTPFYEVQGLAPCPIEDAHDCEAPDGTWCTLYHLITEAEAKSTLIAVMDSDAEMYDRYEDFRWLAPIGARNERYRSHTGFAWDRGERRRRRSKEQTEAEVVPLQRGKRKKVKSR